MEKTLQQYDLIASRCKQLFLKKNEDYGSSWRIMRPSSLTDQLFIKAKRIRNIEELGVQKVDDQIDGEYIGLVNYSIMALIQLNIDQKSPLNLDHADIEAWYNKESEATRALMIQKNHDYGEVWREMRLSSITDLILAKLLRIKQIEDNDGQTVVSEGLEGNYRDIINYSIFSLIKLEESDSEINKTA